MTSMDDGCMWAYSRGLIYGRIKIFSQYEISILILIIFSLLVTIDSVWIDEYVIQNTTRTYTLQITDTHRLVSSVCYTLYYSFLGNGFYQGKFFSFPCSGPLVTAEHAELLLTANSTNWVRG
jgi:hypothetical protein